MKNRDLFQSLNRSRRTSIIEPNSELTEKNEFLHSPVKFSQRIVYAKFLMKFGKLLVRPEQIRWIWLILSRHNQDERVIFLQIVALLEAMNSNGL